MPEFPSDEGVTSHPGLEIDEALDNGPGGTTLRVEKGRAVIPLDNGDGPSRPQHIFQVPESKEGISQVFEEEADKDMVKTLRGKREIIDVCLPE
jgi:hypothetical protein